MNDILRHAIYQANEIGLKGHKIIDIVEPSKGADSPEIMFLTSLKQTKKGTDA